MALDRVKHVLWALSDFLIFIFFALFSCLRRASDAPSASAPWGACGGRIMNCESRAKSHKNLKFIFYDIAMSEIEGLKLHQKRAAKVKTSNWVESSSRSRIITSSKEGMYLTDKTRRQDCVREKQFPKL